MGRIRKSVIRRCTGLISSAIANAGPAAAAARIRYPQAARVFVINSRTGSSGSTIRMVSDTASFRASVAAGCVRQSV